MMEITKKRAIAIPRILQVKMSLKKVIDNKLHTITQ